MAEEANPQRLSNLVRSPWLVFGSMGIVCFLILGGLMIHQFASNEQEKSTLGPAPGFTLRDQRGRLTSLAQFRGKIVLLTFIDPECHQICPLTTQSMVQAVKMLGPRAASQVQLLGVDANPLKTRIADVADYTRTHELEGRWRFLTGPPPQLKRIWRAYHVYVAVGKDDIEHTAVVFLIDQNGYERKLFTTPMSYEEIASDAQDLARGMSQLLPRGERLASVALNPKPATRATGEQGSQFQLTALGTRSQRVMLGTDHPHLLLFFAGWLGQNSNLRRDLSVLDSYAALAHRHGWPSPVAMDETTIEPSHAEAQTILARLAADLKIPIIEDASGRIADGYNVQDLPWFALNSSAGDILWHHDGWISASALDRAVASALSHARTVTATAQKRHPNVHHANAVSRGSR